MLDLQYQALRKQLVPSIEEALHSIIAGTAGIISLFSAFTYVCSNLQSASLCRTNFEMSRPGYTAEQHKRRIEATAKHSLLT